MFGLGKKKNKVEAKVVYETAKGRGPVRKVVVAAGVGAVTVFISPFLRPLIESHLPGVVPEDLIKQIAELLVVAGSVAATVISAYMARPAAGDQPVLRQKP